MLDLTMNLFFFMILLSPWNETTLSSGQWSLHSEKNHRVRWNTHFHFHFSFLFISFYTIIDYSLDAKNVFIFVTNTKYAFVPIEFKIVQSIFHIAWWTVFLSIDLKIFWWKQLRAVLMKRKKLSFYHFQTRLFKVENLLDNHSSLITIQYYWGWLIENGKRSNQWLLINQSPKPVIWICFLK